MGSFYPSNLGLEPGAEVKVQKAFIDLMFSRPLTGFVGDIDWNNPSDVDFDNAVATINAGIESNAHKLRSFEQAYAMEVRGMVDVACEAIPDIIAEMARREGILIDHSVAERNAMVKKWNALIAESLIKGKTRRELGTMNVSATLHASVRWNKGQKLRANDLPDFEHAAAALVYCDAFLTDRRLADRLTQSHVALDKLYECCVVSRPEQAVEWVVNLTEN